MGFMDKVKLQAEQALAKAQQGVSQGQEKLDSMQSKRSGEGLLRELGAAFYAQQRTGGPQEAVQSALAALDAHAAANGPVDTAPVDTTTFAPPAPPAGGASGSATFNAPGQYQPPPTPTFNQPQQYPPPQ